MSKISECVRIWMKPETTLTESIFRGNFNLIKIYFNRYMRYIPTVALLLLFFSSSFQFLLVDGPSIGFLERQVEICHKYWWSSLLLIQTYVNVETICMGVTWYLSADFHLFLLSPLFIYLLWKFGYRVLWLFIAIIVVTQTSIFFLRY
jgi:peptidoglycan/LPS O-acetylase OafA/YrhL